VSRKAARRVLFALGLCAGFGVVYALGAFVMAQGSGAGWLSRHIEASKKGEAK
jgi:hypothetical protein